MANNNETTSWGGVAAWYEALLSTKKGTYQSNVILPSLLRLMKIQPNEKVLDVACGQGFFAAAFVNAGAKVTGVDIAPELIMYAKENVPPQTGATFYASPANELSMIEDGSQDKATIVLAIQNISNPREVFAEIHKKLKTGGRLFIVLNHPCFRVPKGSSWGWDRDGMQYRRVDHYMSESKVPIFMHPGSDLSAKTISFHRPIEFFIKALGRNGFGVVGAEEWVSDRLSDSGPRAEHENEARREIPMFMCLEAVKM